MGSKPRSHTTALTRRIPAGSSWAPAAVYLIMMAVFALGMIWPAGRVWGISTLAYFPTIWQIVFLTLGLSVLPVVYRLTAVHDSNAGSLYGIDGHKSAHLIASSIIAAIFFFAFILFRNETHFLGDGYQLLARLADHSPAVKSWEMVVLFIVHTLFSALGGDSKETALLAYQIVSYAAGAISLLGIIVVSRFLFADTLRRVLFALGLLSCGYSLLFFGYVENYPLFAAMIILTLLVGLLVAKGLIHRFWIMPPMVAAMLFHIFGVALIPGAIYLLTYNSRLAQGVRSLPAKTRMVVGVAGAIILLAGYIYFYSTSFFFRFAVLPLTADQFTVEGETLFASKRMADLFNFLLLLIPGLPLLAVTGVLSSTKTERSSLGIRFLVLNALSALGILFLFNPKLGLPRDWDLFSFSTIPLSMLAYFSVLSCSSAHVMRYRAVILSIMLGFIVLGARVATHLMPDVALAQLRNYLTLDKVKNRTGRVLLISYYEDKNDLEQAKKENDAAEAAYPEMETNRKAIALIQAHRYAEGAALCRRALALNPQYPDAYGNLGLCYMESGKLDSGVTFMEIANGLNPNSPVVMSSLATAYQRQNKFDTAEKLLLDALAIDSLSVNALTNMAVGSLAQSKPEQSLYYLKKVAAVTGKEPRRIFRDAGDEFLARGFAAQAREAYSIALERGIDSAYVIQQLQKCRP